MSASSVVVGIDVAKAHVDVVVLGAEIEPRRFDNDAEAHSVLAAALQPLAVALVVMEATGGYEAALACALQAVGLPVAVVNRECPNFCVRGALRLVHGGGRRLRRTTDAVVKSVPHITRRSW